MIIQEDLYGNWEYNYSIIQKLIQIQKQVRSQLKKNAIETVNSLHTCYMQCL
jgi:hypothetical protein